MIMIRSLYAIIQPRPNYRRGDHQRSGQQTAGKDPVLPRPAHQYFREVGRN